MIAAKQATRRELPNAEAHLANKGEPAFAVLRYEFRKRARRDKRSLGYRRCLKDGTEQWALLWNHLLG